LDVVRLALFVPLILGAVVLGGCGGSVPGKSTAGATRVTILAVNPSVGRAIFRLSCRPAKGDVPSPGHACAVLERHPDLLTNPTPFICEGGPWSWWDLAISGRLDGNLFRAHISSCWTPQMALIGELGIARSLQSHLLPRRVEGLVGVEKRTFAPGVLRPGDLVTCKIRGRRLELGIPVETGPPGPTTGFGRRFGELRAKTSGSLTVWRNGNGSVTAKCW
jgi:hypothetical protein